MSGKKAKTPEQEALENYEGGLRQIAAYEAGQIKGRTPARNAGKIAEMMRHHKRHAELAEACGHKGASPLVGVIQELAEAAGVPVPEGIPAAKPRADQPPATSGTDKPPGDGDPDNSDEDPAPDDATGLLPRGDWLKAHADIIEREIPEVKAHAAAPENYASAKRAFIDRHAAALDEYAAKPGKKHSPLFTYFALFLSDLGDLKSAEAVCEKAIALRQESAIKRDFHAILFDVRKAAFERQAEAAVTAQDQDAFERLKSKRDALMNDPFRGNHAKADVAQTFASAALALGHPGIARDNLLQVKFLNPERGVETLLAKAEAALGKAE